MTYEQFIERLRQLISQGETLLQRPATHEAQDFRDWWMHVRNDVEVMERDYELPVRFGAHRHFRAMTVLSDRVGDALEFDRDMRDTLGELRRLVDQYQYGPSRRKHELAKAAPAGAAGGHTFNINNSTIGAVQAGQRSSAHLVISATDLMRLTDALARLRAEINQGARLSEDEREQTVGLIDDIMQEARAPTPAPRRLSAFLNALSTTIQTAAATPGAWHAAYQAAHALGWL